MPSSSATTTRRTLAEWNRRFRQSWPEIEPLGFDPRFKRMWEFYLAYCEGGFRAGSIDVTQLTLSGPLEALGPFSGTAAVTRRDLFLYALPAFALGMPTIPAYVFLPSFYAEEVGIGLGTVGAVPARRPHLRRGQRSPRRVCSPTGWSRPGAAASRGWPAAR